ncbi:MAG: hypothetical protein ACM3ZQ_08190, partial [Bacillota bacterium]
MTDCHSVPESPLVFYQSTDGFFRIGLHSVTSGCGLWAAGSGLYMALTPANDGKNSQYKGVGRWKRVGASP